MTGEHQALLKELNSTREHILEAYGGLDDEILRREMLPSGWTYVGLVNHLAIDVERFWFQAVIVGDAVVIDQVLHSSNNAWKVDADAKTETILNAYRFNIERANAILSAAEFDSAPAWWPEDLFGSWRIKTVRGIVLHVLSETATHAGQLDAARELIDGKQYLVLTD